MLVVYRASIHDQPTPSGQSLTVAAIGFALEYNLACGGELIADAMPRTLVTNDEINYAHCQYVITTEEPGKYCDVYV